MTTSSAPSRVIAILTAALGGAVVVGTVVGAVVPTVASASAAAPGRDEDYSVEVDGVRAIDVDVAAVAFTVRFDDIDEATLEVRGGRDGAWTLVEEDGTLFVETPDRPFRWVGDWSWGGRDARATLTLPRELEGSDVDVEFGAGAFDADGRFGEFDLDLGAGQATLAGSATSLSVDMGAGRADIDLDDVRTATLELSAGAMVADLGGTAPDGIELAVSAGSLELTVPDEEYDVSSEVSAGDFTHDLRTASDAPRTLHAEVSAGDIRVRAD